LEPALVVTKAAHTIPAQMGKILEMTRPRMAALWHMDVSPGVDGVFAEIGERYDGAVAVCQDLTVFDVTPEAVLVRQAQVNDAPSPVHGPSRTEPVIPPAPEPPGWWAEALLDV
jgi:hypothetical protein